MLRIVEVGAGTGVGSDVIEALALDWRALQLHCQRLTPFQTWEWNAAWWRRFGSHKRPHILLFWATDAEGSSRSSEQDKSNREILVGIAPLYTSFHLSTPLRRLAWIGTGQSDYLGPLARAGWETDVACVLRAYIDSDLRGWNMADLQQMRPDEPLLLDAVRLQSGEANATSCVLPIEPCPYVALPADWTTFTTRLSKKMRSNLGYYDRLLCKTFKQVAYKIADASTLEAGMTALFALHQQRWHKKWLPGVLGSKRVQAFHRDVAQVFLANGWLRLHLLTIDGNIQAVLYCFALGGVTSYYLGGFAPAMSRYSLGTLLTGRAIRYAIEEQGTEFDFLRGNEDYKYRWLPAERINQRLLLLRRYGSRGNIPTASSNISHGSVATRTWNRLKELPGRAGFAINRVERYIALRAKAFAEHKSSRS